ncbi:MAG: sugar phosphate isomerase/epimerase family protein [Atribacterales bacterium]
MDNSWPISVGANLYRGYDLKTVCQSLSKLGARYVDLDFIKPPSAFRGSGYGAHVTEEDLGKANQFRKVIEDYGLDTITFSGHMFLITREEVELFQRKMEFAKDIGAQYISTNEGPKSEEDRFYQNLEIIEKKAEELDIVVCLETEMPGDIIQNGEDARVVFSRINSPYLGLTYDFGNVYYGHRGQIDLIGDFQKTLDFLKTLHFKDVKVEEGILKNCTIGQGVINFKRVCQILKETEKVLPITIEIPYFFQSKNWAPFDTLEEIKPLEEIEEMVKESIAFIQSALEEGSRDEN